MNARTLMPFSRNRSVSRRPQDADPIVALRRDMDSLFDDFFTNFGLPALGGLGLPALAGDDVAAGTLTPRIDVSETDQEIRIAAELPGIDENNVEVMVADDLLTIRGEKTEEREEDERGYHVRERSRGTFARSLRLPFSVDPNQVQASFRNGVLNITIPKPKEAQEKVRRVEVKRDEGASDARMSGVDRAAAGDKPSASDQQSSREGQTASQSSTGGRSSKESQSKTATT